MTVTTTSEAQGLVEELDPAALAAAAVAALPVPVTVATEAEGPTRRPGRKSLLTLALCALAINGSAAVYTMPSDLHLPSVSTLAELLPSLMTPAPAPVPAPKPDPVLAALKDILSAQQQHAASLQENNHLLQQNKALLQQDSMMFATLRQSITDERVDVKKASSQLSTLIAKVDALQSAVVMSEVTSSVRKAHARMLSSAMRKRMVREPKPLGPVSVGGAPLSIPATTSDPES
jgi:hypothetical protein